MKLTRAEYLGDYRYTVAFDGADGAETGTVDLDPARFIRPPIPTARPAELEQITVNPDALLWPTLGTQMPALRLYALMHEQKLRLWPGKFYRSRDGHLWCCFKVDVSAEEHCRAHCIRVEDGRVEYFYLDGRYDSDGKREHTLIRCEP